MRLNTTTDCHRRQPRSGQRDLPKGEGSSLVVVNYDAAVEQDAFEVVKELQ